MTSPDAQSSDDLLRAEVMAASAARATLQRFSHNIRTPLQTVCGFLKLIDRQQVSGTVGEYLDHVGMATRHLEDMAIELTEQLGTTPERALQATCQDLTAIVARVTGWMQPIAVDHDVELTVRTPDLDVEGGPGVEVWGIESRITEILTNLISNAIRYNRREGTVELRTFRRGDVNGVAVRDDGPGLGPDELLQAFSPFVRLETAGRGGSGLGLPLARSLAESMGGGIEAESHVGSGSEFRLLLPAAPTCEPERDVTAGTTAPEESGSGQEDTGSDAG